MSKTIVRTSLPLDDDAFLRLECWTCEPQFKWRPGSDEVIGAAEMPETFYCPYCAEPTDTGSWRTPQQREYLLQYAAARVVGTKLEEFQRGKVGVNVDVTLSSQPAPLMEPNDMVRVDFPCHLEEPLKVAED